MDISDTMNLRGFDLRLYSTLIESQAFYGAMLNNALIFI